MKVDETIEIDGVVKTAREWLIENHIAIYTFHARIARGYDPQRAATEPVLHRKKTGVVFEERIPVYEKKVVFERVSASAGYYKTIKKQVGWEEKE